MRKVWQREQRIALEANVPRVVEKVFFVRNLIATLGASSNAVLAAEVQGESAVFIDLQKNRVVSLVANFLAQRQS